MATGRDRSEVVRLIEAEDAARQAGASASGWWRELASAATSARTRRELDDLFRSSLSTMRDSLGADAFVLLVANERGDELMARVAIGLSQELALGVRISEGQGMAGLVMAARAPLLVDDLSEVPVASPALRDSGLRSVAAVPLLFEERLLGVMYAGSRELARFTPTDVELLELLAARLAAALERVQAFEVERSARVRAERDADRLARLQVLAARLVSASSTEEVATAVAEALAAGSVGHGAASSDVWLLREGRLARVQAPAAGRTGCPAEVALTEEVPIVRAFLERRPVYQSVPDPPDPPGPDPVPGATWALLPVVVRGEPRACVAVAYPPERPVDEHERAFLASTVDQAAHALERVRLHEEQVAQGAAAAYFARAAKSVAEASDLGDALGRLAELALTAFGDLCMIDVLDEDGELQRLAAHHRDPAYQDLVERLRADYPPQSASPVHPVVQVVRTGAPKWSARMGEPFLRSVVRDRDHLELVRSLGLRSYLCVPLVTEHSVLGALTVVSSGEQLEPENVAFAERLADQVAAVVENARRYEATLQTSTVLQQSLLPQRLPEVPGLDVDTRYLPCTRGLEVGGDFYDLSISSPDEVRIMIGDVAGHDRQAAALMGHLRTAARLLAGQVGRPAAVVAALQKGWDLLEFDRMATGLFARLDPGTGTLEIASAGHYPPLLVGVEGARFLPVEPAVPLGVPGPEPVDWHGSLAPGQLLLLYTDGAVEDHVTTIDEGMARLAKAAAAGDLHPASVCSRVVRSLPRDRRDDVALLALRRRPVGAPAG